MRSDDILATVVISWREPIQINGSLNKFFIIAVPEGGGTQIASSELTVTDVSL